MSGPFSVSDNKASVSCPATASLAPGASITCTASYTITQADLDAGSVTNVASATNGTTTSPTDTETVTAVPNASLSIVKTATQQTYNQANQQISYSYLVTNNGNVTLNGPFSVSDNKASVSCPATASLAPGASITCTASYTITQADLDAGSVTNVASATNGTTTSPTDTETVTAVPNASLSIVKTATQQTYGQVGEVIDYSYLVTNSGNITLNGPFFVNDDKASVICPATASLAPGASITCTATYTITQADLDAGSVTNTASATNETTTSPTTSETVTAVRPAPPPPPPATGAIGDRVFIDLSFNANGNPVNLPDGAQAKDSNGQYLEPGVPTIIVELYDADTNSLVSKTTTDANGFYRFDDLLSGNYYIIFRLPQGVAGVWTFANADGVPDDANSDAAIQADQFDTARQTSVITLSEGEVNLTVDAGLISLSGLGSTSLGGIVWLDSNKNGIQDEGEVNFSNPVTVNLHQCSDNALVATQSTVNGDYAFDGLDAGEYYVEFEVPTGYVATLQDQGTNDALDSDADPQTGRTECTTLVAFENEGDWDLGVFQGGGTPPTNLDPVKEPGAFNSRLFIPAIRK